MPENTPSSRFVRFGLYEVDFAAGELRKGGLKIKLQDRPFEILRILLGRPGEIVSREEFRERLWPADTFVDFDHSLNASINKLRLALGDDADNPRFIATAGRRGYRFIAPVGGAGSTAISELAQVPPPTPQDSSKETPAGATQPTEALGSTASAKIPAAAPPRSPWKFYGLALALIFLFALGFRLLLRWRAKPPLLETDFILISDFVNTTGEPIFDDSLKQALTVKLSESPFLNVEPDMKVRQQLGLMGQQPTDRVFFPIDLELCQRVGAKALVAGSIVSVGDKYEVDLRAQDCLNGSVLVHLKADAGSREQVLSAMGTILPGIRRTLGESLSSIQKFDTPIEQATTTSLAALKAYTEGDKKRQQGLETESIPFYKLATELDPNFAIANARLAVAFSNSQEYALSEQYLQKAFDKREHVTEREKLYISAHYYGELTRQEEHSIETYELWRQIYPRDWIAANNLANEYTAVGRLDKAIEAGQAALRLNPAHSFPYTVLARAYKRSGRFAESKTICEKAAAADFDSVEFHDLLFEIAFAEGDQSALQHELDWSKGKSREETILNTAAQAANALGQLKSAHALYQKARERALAAGFKEYVAALYLDEAQFLAEIGKPADALEIVALAYKLGDLYEDRQSDAGLIFARSGNSVRAEKMNEDLKKQYPLHTMMNNVQLAEVRAAIAMHRKDPTRAIEELKSAIPYDLGSPPDLWTMYYRGLAYLQLGHGKEAADEFQRLLDHQSIATTTPAIPLARLGLARAYALSGETAKSRSAYEEFFTRWKDADTNIPVLKEAKAEYSKLSAS